MISIDYNTHSDRAKRRETFRATPVQQLVLTIRNGLLVLDKSTRRFMTDPRACSGRVGNDSGKNIESVFDFGKKENFNTFEFASLVDRRCLIID